MQLWIPKDESRLKILFLLSCAFHSAASEMLANFKYLSTISVVAVVEKNVILHSNTEELVCSITIVLIFLLSIRSVNWCI